jgi:hypothetical protein
MSIDPNAQIHSSAAVIEDDYNCGGPQGRATLRWVLMLIKNAVWKAMWLSVALPEIGEATEIFSFNIGTSHRI